MKSEHRHELQANELNKYTEQTVGFFKTYGNQIMIAVCLLSIAASGMIYWQRISSTRLEQAWSDLAFATQASEFQFIVSDPSLSKTPAAPWARLKESETRLQEGIRLMFTERERAIRELDLAKTGFQELADQTSLDPIIRERAEYGLARSLETLSDGKLDKAIAAYEKLLKDFPDSVFKPTAEQQIKSLQRSGAGEFYAWFSKQKPTSATPPRLPSDKGRAGADAKKGTSDLKDDPTSEVLDTKNPEVPRLDAPSTEPDKAGANPAGDKTPAKGTDPARAALPKDVGPKLEAPSPKAPEAKDPKTSSSPPKTEDKAAPKTGDAKTPAAAGTPAKKADEAPKTGDKPKP